MARRVWKAAIPIAAVLILGAQLYQPDLRNPAHDPAADFESVARPSPEAAAVIRNSCRNCHSNRTEWPWYSRVSPVSWLVASDVQNGRAKLNLSEWNLYGTEMSALRMRQMCSEARSGRMPLWQYTLMHPGSKPDDRQIQALCATTPAM